MFLLLMPKNQSLNSIYTYTSQYKYFPKFTISNSFYVSLIYHRIKVKISPKLDYPVKLCLLTQYYFIMQRCLRKDIWLKTIEYNPCLMMRRVEIFYLTHFIIEPQWVKMRQQ